MAVALCVGIDYYKHANPLHQCCIDARSVAQVLNRNGDGTKNFNDIVCALAEDEETALTRAELRAAVEKLFSTQTDTVLFYFSGHGAVDAYGGYLCTSEVDNVDDGLSMDVLMQIVERSPALNKIIILDSCHSGQLGNSNSWGAMSGFCKLPDNTTILAACGGKGVSYEGVFTPLLVDALAGGAMNLLGEVTPGGIYSYIDRSMGDWFQRPVFKANVKNFICLRKCKAPIDIQKLHQIVDFFPSEYSLYQLDPTYEEDKRPIDAEKKVVLDEKDWPEDAPVPEVNKEHEAIMKIFRKYHQLNLLVPVEEEYMYWAARLSDCVKLTAQGRFYWKLVNENRI